MFKNYFKITWRYLAKNKTSSIINVLGLSLGVASCLIIFLIIRHELSFDTFHPDKERIYRVYGERTHQGKTSLSTGMSPATSLAIRDEVTGVETAAFFYNYQVKVSVPEQGEYKQFNEPRSGVDPAEIVVAEPQYFDIFQYHWLAGNPVTFTEPSVVILTANKAKKYFGDIPYDQMLGRELIYDNALTVNVAGIVADWNKKTDFTFTDFISMATVPGSVLKGQLDRDADNTMQVYVKLSKDATFDAVADQFPSFVGRHFKPVQDMKVSIFLQPLADVHFNTKLRDVYSHPVHQFILYGLTAIAVFILVIAACNFINLSTAQSLQRGKEVGIRKVLGSSRKKLMAQFLNETLLITIVAVIISLLAARPLLSLFGSFVPQGISLELGQPFTWLFLLAITICTTLLAGFYPAKVLSSALPLDSIKSATHKGSSRNWLRKSLIVFQFTISLVFIICTIIIGDQIHYMMSKDMGFDKDAIVHVEMKGNLQVMAEKIRQLPYVEDVSLHQETPAADQHNFTRFSATMSGVKQDYFCSFERCDENFIPLYGIKLVAGRNVLPSEYMKEFVVNEAFVRQLGYQNPEDAIGQMLTAGIWDQLPDGASVPEGQRQAPIVGVVADYHLSSLHSEIVPICISASNQKIYTMSVKLSTQGKSAGETKQILADFGKVWKEINPNEQMELAFFDDTIASFYENERKTEQIISISMFMAIFISCMGLFGLAVFMTKQRTKEIAIRKVLGARIGHILILLSNDFLKLILVAVIIASPIAWYAMSHWLNDFAYHVPVRWWIFILAGVFAIVVALATICAQSLKAAMANPVKAIKSE